MTELLQDIRLYDAVLRNDLSSFIAKTFHTVDPSTPYLPNWHIEAIAEYLTAAARGDIQRLIINMPPRSLKSVCVSVAWPAWMLGRNPATRVMAASYSQTLSLRHSLDCRLVMMEPWYRRLFPKTHIITGQNEKAKFVTTERGFRFATSVGGTATGEGGDVLIIDDPHNPSQIMSTLWRQQAIDWFQQSFMSRLNNKHKGVVVLVMQRLHKEDLSGYLLAQQPGNWEHLCLPAIAEQPIAVHFGNFLKERPAGDMLHPGREGIQLLERAKQELGSYAFAAQYQQQPVSKEQGMLRPVWIKRYTEPPHTPESIVLSWDTAIKAGDKNDYSVCTVWAVVNDGYYLLDLIRQRTEYPELKHLAHNLAEKWQPHAILIEDKASGQSLLQDLRRESAYPLIPIMPKADKVTRFASVTPLFEAGRVFFPTRQPWLVDLEMELLGFPTISHDDQVDSIAQFLHWARARSTQGQWRIRGV